MAGYVTVGTLAAYGLLCALWAVFGWLLPEPEGWVLVRMGPPPVRMPPRVRWLAGAGLLRCPLLVVADGAETAPDMEICSREALISRLEMERKRFDGTGNGDHSGHHQRGGVSEL